MEEVWKPVFGYTDIYEASSLGRVRRSRGGRGATVGRLLRFKKPTWRCDYMRVQLCCNDVKRTYSVHAIVAEAFHGKRPRGKFVNHIDMNKTNNAACNLEWVTAKQNAQHSLSNGRHGGRPMKGAANGRAKLTQDQVDEIRRQKGRIGQRILAALCGVSKTAIQTIHQGKHWSVTYEKETV